MRKHLEKLKDILTGRRKERRRRRYNVSRFISRHLWNNKSVWMKKLSSLTSFSLSADKHVWIRHTISSHSNNPIHQILIKASNSLTLYLVLLPLLLKTTCNLLKAQHLFEFVVKITCTEVKH